MQAEITIQKENNIDRWLFSPSIDLTVFLGAAVLAVSAGSGFWIRDMCRSVFRRRSRLLEGFGGGRGLSFCPAAIRVGRAISKKTERNNRLDLVDRHRGSLYCDDLSVGFLDDAAAAKFLLVPQECVPF